VRTIFYECIILAQYEIQQVSGGRLVQRIGVLGGTFNPIHYGHLAAAEEVRGRLSLERVLFIPSHIPPHKHEDDIPSAVQRMEMVRLAVSSNAFFKASDIEIKRGGISYAIDTIEELLRLHTNTELYFITGIDAFMEIHTWRRWQDLLALSHFAVMTRPGHDVNDIYKMDFMKDIRNDLTGRNRGDSVQGVVNCGEFAIHLVSIPLFDISSTDIRRRVKQGVSIKYLLPEAVETYIIKNKLYA
jgi:nicotinate-nucleotide adenylyltransferase